MLPFLIVCSEGSDKLKGAIPIWECPRCQSEISYRV